ncbi:MAG: hypothetical protein FWG21_01195, partial [Oscillospiraceae bacterium]|nr:hypothetical protein [Oscillospiraceae bacterium]
MVTPEPAQPKQDDTLILTDDIQMLADKYALSERDLNNIRVNEGITRDNAKTELMKLAGKWLINEETGIAAQIIKAQRGKIISDMAVYKSMANGFTREQHNATAANIEELWRLAKLDKVHGDKNNDVNVVSIKRFTAPIILSGTSAEAYLTVKQTIEAGHRIYSLELTEIKATPPQDSTPYGDTVGNIATSEIIAQPNTSVNTTSGIESIDNPNSYSNAMTEKPISISRNEEAKYLRKYVQNIKNLFVGNVKNKLTGFDIVVGKRAINETTTKATQHKGNIDSIRALGGIKELAENAILVKAENLDDNAIESNPYKMQLLSFATPYYDSEGSYIAIMTVEAIFDNDSSIHRMYNLKSMEIKRIASSSQTGLFSAQDDSATRITIADLYGFVNPIRNQTPQPQNAVNTPITNQSGYAQLIQILDKHLEENNYNIKVAMSSTLADNAAYGIMPEDQARDVIVAYIQQSVEDEANEPKPLTLWEQQRKAAISYWEQDERQRIKDTGIGSPDIKREQIDQYNSSRALFGLEPLSDEDALVEITNGKYIPQAEFDRRRGVTQLAETDNSVDSSANSSVNSVDEPVDSVDSVDEPIIDTLEGYNYDTSTGEVLGESLIRTDVTVGEDIKYVNSNPQLRQAVDDTITYLVEKYDILPEDRLAKLNPIAQKIITYKDEGGENYRNALEELLSAIANEDNITEVAEDISNEMGKIVLGDRYGIDSPHYAPDRNYSKWKNNLKAKTKHNIDQSYKDGIAEVDISREDIQILKEVKNVNLLKLDWKETIRVLDELSDGNPIVRDTLDRLIE